MRFQHTSLSQLSKSAKNTQLLQTQTVFVLSESQWKKGRWLSHLPSEIRERAQLAADRLKTPLEAGGKFCVPGLKESEEDLWIVLLPNKTETYFLLEFARDTLKQTLDQSTKSFRLILEEDLLSPKIAEAFGAALVARTFLMPVFGKREEKVKPWKLDQFELVSEHRKDLEALQYGYATGGGTNLARYLATIPQNILDPENYGDWIRHVAKENGISVKFYSKDQLKKMGAGAFTAVDRGNPDSKGGIYELSYNGKKAKQSIHLVGKGICHDTGGYDVKVGGGMYTMKGDMQGSAVALATLVTAVNLQLPYKMKAYLAVTENHISPAAYRADEVITALNGLTIEVVNTDAEGRMILADALTLASREKPDYVIDFATLTGSAVRSIGTKYSAGFTNRDELHDVIKEAGKLSGERIWTFPMDSSFHKGLESKVADTLQCVKGGSPDHIMAACFLGKFIEADTPWIHIDLSAAENEGGIGHVDSLFTGFGVRWAIEFCKLLQN